MTFEDIKEPCVECFHEPSCRIKHPELEKEHPVSGGHPTCEKLDKYTSHIRATRTLI